MTPAEESAAVDPAVLRQLMAVAASIRAGQPRGLPDRLAWESECLQILDRVWPRCEVVGGDHPVPESIGRFEVIRELGRGGFGIVYLARDPNLGREVALKVPLPGMITAPEVRRRFLREARAVSGLDHPNIVPIHDAVTVGPVAYIVSAYCPGPSLAAWLRAQTEPVPPRMAARLVEALARGVAHAHERKILHRDLKPANVMLQPGGDPEAGGVTPRVTDFGLAKMTDGSAIDETRTGLIIGSAPYMAPEQAAGNQGEVGPSTDVYALGATLYEILVGRPPVLGRSQGETLHLVLTTDPVAPRVLRREVPADLQTICLKALRKNPLHRYPTADDFGADLARFLDDQPIQARPESPLARGWQWARRHPAPATSVVAGLIMVVLIGVGIVWSNLWLRTHNEELRREVARTDQQAAEANRQRRLVADREAITDRHLHAARLNLARQAISAGQPERAQAILADPSAAAGTGRHDFTWHYLWNQARRDLAVWGHHEAMIRQVALSPDRATLASADQAGQVRLWDVATQQLKQTFGDPTGTAEWLSFAPDGRTLAVGGHPSRDSKADAQIVLWDLNPAEPRLRTRIILPNIKAIARMMFAADNQTLLVLMATTTENQLLQSWDVAPSPVARDAARLRFTTPDCAAAVLATDGRSVWTIEPGGRLNQRDPATGAELPRICQDATDLGAIALAPNGRWLAGSDHSNRVLVWDLATLGPPRVLTRESLPPDELIFNVDSMSLLVSAEAMEVRLVPLDGGPAHVIVPLNPGRHGRFRFAFAPDGRSMVMNGDIQPGGFQPLTLWETRTGRHVRTFQGRRGFKSSAFDATGAAVLVANDYDLGCWYPFAPVDESVPSFDDHHDEVWSAVLAPDGQTLASGGDDDQLRFLNLTTGVRSHVIPAHHATVSTLAWHPNGWIVASGALPTRTT